MVQAASIGEMKILLSPMLPVRAETSISLDRIADAVVIHDHPDPALSGRLPLDQI
jgi:hypothetical protein